MTREERVSLPPKNASIFNNVTSAASLILHFIGIIIIAGDGGG